MRGQADPWEMTVLLEMLEEALGRILQRWKPGRKRGYKRK